MSRDCDASLRRMEVAVGFICVLFAASSLADPVNKVAVTSSVATPLASAQLVASASNRDEGLSPVPPKEAAAASTRGLEDDKQTGAAASGGVMPPPPPAVASEAGDMMKDPYHNVTTMSSSDRDEEALINSETDTVQDSHVNPINRTHEEEASASSQDAPLDSSTLRQASPVAVTESSTARQASPVAVTESSTSIVEQTDKEERVEEKEQPGKTSEEVDVTERDGEISLAEVTSLPVSALVSQHDGHDHPVISRNPSLNHTTQVAAILAGVLVLVAMAGYLGLLLWRRVLEKRYGNREMLVNEEDDFKHFEL